MEDCHMLLKTLGQRVRILRQEMGLSQEQFALRADMDRTYLAGIENGKRNITVKMAQKLADTFGITLSELFLGVSEDNKVYDVSKE